MYVCMYVCMYDYVCIYVYICIYIYIGTNETGTAMGLWPHVYHLPTRAEFHPFTIVNDMGLSENRVYSQ